MAFSSIWCADTEYIPISGGRSIPLCFCAVDVLSGRQIRRWQHELAFCPISTGPDTLFVAYAAQAEIGFFLACNWPVPPRILDLYVEFRAMTNGLSMPVGPDKKRYSLLCAMIHHGLCHMAPQEKQERIDRILAGGPWSHDDSEATLDYCMEDVNALVALLPAMAPAIAATPARFRQALLRGRQTHAVAAMVHHGIPIDVDLLAELREHWEAIQLHLITTLEPELAALFDGLHFRAARFTALVERRGYFWPTLKSGVYKRDSKTFKTMAGIYPGLEPLRQLLATIGAMRLRNIAVGPDGRNRSPLHAFGTKTGRNKPSSNEYIFGLASWMRSLIKPARGRALAYLDWTSQEIFVAAVLSNDRQLIDAVRTGDPYIAFAIQAGLAPPGATKATHGAVRDRVKACVLGINYGMGERTLATRLEASLPEARLLLHLFDERYPVFASWREQNLDRALIGRPLSTVFGWRLLPNPATKPNTLRNFPVQATGAELMRLAASLGVEAGVQICGPIHDAFLIEAANSEIDAAVATMRAAMNEASRVVLDGLEVGIDAQIIRYPDRYRDPRGAELFARVTELLASGTLQAATAQRA